MTTYFNLREFIAEVCDTFPTADPAIIAIEVLNRIPRVHYRAALEQALPSLVNQVISRQRHNIPAATFTAGASAATGVRVAERAAPSWKVIGIRETWQRLLRDRINVGPEPSEWKFLSDCTVPDLHYAADVRDEHARRNAARAAQYRQLAALLVEHGVDTVGNLPENLLFSILGENS